MGDISELPMLHDIDADYVARNKVVAILNSLRH